MLKELCLVDYVLAKTITLNFEDGVSVLTGETGAGKSLILDAINLILGNRASLKTIRTGKSSAQISALFDIDKNTACCSWLEQHDILHQDGEYCLIKRVIQSDAKSRATINGSTVTLAMLREFTSSLIEIHGQNQQLAFTDRSYQRFFLDRYASCEELLRSYQECYQEYLALEKVLVDLKNNSSVHASNVEYLRYQVSELDTLNIQEGEWESICRQHQSASHQGDRIEHLQLICDGLDGRDGIVSQLHSITSRINASKGLQNEGQDLLRGIEQAQIELSEVAKSANHLLSDSDLSSLSVEELDSRMSAIHDIARKHQIEPEELIECGKVLKQKLVALEKAVNSIEEEEARFAQIREKLLSMASDISVKRVQAALHLSQQVSKYFESLLLPSARFSIVVEKNNKNISMHGMDTIDYMVSFNPGINLGPIEKVASGGELSRVALALHLALTHNSAEEKYRKSMFFDEVETGIGGQAIVALGKLLEELGSHHQILVITHQAQIAVIGENHYLVEKTHHNNNTEVAIQVITGEERVKEVTRMLGGTSIDDARSRLARDLLKNNGKIGL